MSQALKTYILSNINVVEGLLESYGFQNIHKHGEVIKFAYDEDSKGSCMINLENLSYKRWSDGTTGDIITLIMSKLNCGFKVAINDAKYKLGITNIEIIQTKHNESSIFKDLLINITEVKGTFEYTKRELNKYAPIISQVFRKDGIHMFTQIKFDIRYDEESDRIVIFWKDILGNIVGCVGRANWSIKPTDQKYLALLPFSKRKYLFGLCENLPFIQSAKHCIIVEAEKSTMQADSFGVNNIVSIGMSHIDKLQIQNLYDIGCRKVTLAYDEDKDYVEYVKKAENIKKWFTDIEVYAIIDKENKYLFKGSKLSPTDLGLEAFNGLCRDCTIKM
ncbi:MAG: hypothetical protein ACRC6E_14465 [Fusobacteriaceae bacterium]